MNRLPFEKRRQILHLMVEGNSIRGIARLVDVSPVTVLRQLEIAGLACARWHDENVRNLNTRRAESDEIWSFNYCKKANLAKAKAAPEGAGDAWTWTCLDADSKLIISYMVGGRDAEWAGAFMQDVADRVSNRIQLTTDGHKAYLGAVEDAFGAGIDYAMLVKHYGETPDGKGVERKYSPGICTGITKRQIEGKPDARHVSTSYVEKHNQSMRQHMRRFTRLTAAHSKKLVNHIHMVALYTTWYNWVRINSAVKVTPAMAAGISDRLWEMDDLVRMVEEFEKSEVTIHMPLLEEGTDVWRPVQAKRLAEGQYRIIGNAPADEIWTFAPGTVVTCESKVFSDGQKGLVPVAAVKL